MWAHQVDDSSISWGMQINDGTIPQILFLILKYWSNTVFSQPFSQPLRIFGLRMIRETGPILIGYLDAIRSDRPSTGSADPAAPHVHGLGAICAQRFQMTAIYWND